MRDGGRSGEEGTVSRESSVVDLARLGNLVGMEGKGEG